MRLLVFPLVMVMAVACSKDEPPPAQTAGESAPASAPAAAAPAAQPEDVCAGFTAQDATEIAGRPMERDANVSSDCQFQPADEDVSSGATLNFQINRTTDMYDFLSGRQGAEQISGLGEKAVWNPQLNQFAVVKGGREIFGSVQGLKGDDAKLKTLATALASKVLTKI